MKADGIYRLIPNDEQNVAVISCKMNQESVVGIFSLKNSQGSADVYLKDGSYENLLTNEEIRVVNGKLPCDKMPVLVKTETANLVDPKRME